MRLFPKSYEWGNEWFVGWMAVIFVLSVFTFSIYREVRRGANARIEMCEKRYRMASYERYSTVYGGRRFDIMEL